MNKIVKMHCKSVMANFFTVVFLLVKISTAISEPKGPLDESSSIWQHSVTVTSNNPIISSYLFNPFFFSSIMKTNSIFHQSRG